MGFGGLGASANDGIIDEYQNIETVGEELAAFDLKSRGIQEKDVIMANGELATVGTTPVIEPSNGLLRASNGNYKAYWYTGTYNCSFKFTVKSNKITRVYDKWYRMYGVSVKSNKLKLDNSKQATYYFEFGMPIWDLGGWNGWLRAKINGSNKIVYSIK